MDVHTHANKRDSHEGTYRKISTQIKAQNSDLLKFQISTLPKNKELTMNVLSKLHSDRKNKQLLFKYGMDPIRCGRNGKNNKGFMITTSIFLQFNRNEFTQDLIDYENSLR